jgi:hypothetical protein
LTFFSFIVALTLLLISTAYDVRASVLRGALWGTIVAIGALSKISFGFFIVLIGPVLLYLRWKNAGTNATLITLVSVFIVTSPATAMFIARGKGYFAHAVESSFGDIGQFYGGMGPLKYIAQYIMYLGWGLYGIAMLAIMTVATYAKKPRPSWLMLYPVAVTLSYYVLTALSPNHDFRFAAPVMVGLPLLLASMTANGPRDSAKLVVPALVALLFGVMVSVPMIARPDLSEVQTAQKILINLSNATTAPVSVLVGSEGQYFNINTVQLAQQMEYPKLKSMQVSTIVYDFVSGVALQESMRSIDRADYVMFLNPQGANDWSTHFLKDYRDRAAQIGERIDVDSSHGVEIYRIRHP